MTIDNLFNIFKRLGVWRADVIETNLSPTLLIIVPNENNKKSLELLNSRVPACIRVKIEVDKARFRGRKKYSYNSLVREPQ